MMSSVNEKLHNCMNCMGRLTESFGEMEMGGLLFKKKSYVQKLIW